MTHRMRVLTVAACLFSVANLFAASEGYPPKNPKNASLRNEVGLAIDRGLNFLRSQQAADGSWSMSDLPALTALVTTAYLREPSGTYRKEKPEFLKKALDFIAASQQPDGGIYRKGYLNYNTSICVMALLAAEDPSYQPALLRARDFIAGMQYENAPDKVDDALNGGIGYGNKNKNPDLSNTVMALEALRHTKSLEAPGEKQAGKKLNWDAAIGFVQRCQNLPENKDPWVSPEAEDRGGFFYQPGSTRGAEVTLPDGKKYFRSYGSMTYAGLLSYIYCDLKPEDPRVTAAIDWLQKNFNLEKNPGIGSEEGQEGIYYYYHMMAKALSIYGIDELQAADGKKIEWRKELGEKLLSLQKADGSWTNPNNRWMETDSVLVTSYAVLALEMIYRGL